MQLVDGLTSYHVAPIASLLQTPAWSRFAPFTVQKYDYDFEVFFHPFVGRLIEKLNDDGLSGMLSADFLASLTTPYGQPEDPSPLSSSLSIPEVTASLEAKTIDVATPGGPYAAYNWELTYHIPVAIAVHLSNNARYAEAQARFHQVFNPSDPQQNFWRAYPFSSQTKPPSLSSIIDLLSSTDPASAAAKAQVVTGYNAILANPFDPFVVARTRPGAFQWYVVMKYLDNLIAWGDSLFLQDTVETLNEATLCYVLAANLLGPKPQPMPQPGTTAVRNFLQLEQAGFDRMSDALVALESQFPFDTVSVGGSGGADLSGALFGIGRSLYFCIPQNQKLLAYWDTVADRLFKIRNSENIQGVYQQLPLFDPPLDPGMLVQAAAAGIDIGAIVSGVNQPVGPLRALPMIQRAMQLAAEVKAMGAALLTAIEKGDAESLALLRQANEVEVQSLTENIRFLQWRHAQESTNALIASRASAVERYGYYLRLMGLAPDAATVPPTLTPNRVELTESNWDDTYQTLVGQYEQAVATLNYGPLRLDQGSSPSAQSGANGAGALFLNVNEAAELNLLLPGASALQFVASAINTTAGPLNLIPSLNIDAEFWGLGVHSEVFSGRQLAEVVQTVSQVMQMVAAQMRDQANIASKTSAYQRRADEWTLQANLAADELTTLGTQILASLIAEQIAYHEYTTTQAQVQQAKDVQNFLQTKFTNAVLYGWMQSQLSGLYYQYYRLACDTARRAELTMKRELMRPELDQTQYIQFNYWDTGHQGLLSGEALHFDLERLETAYHDANARELEAVAHVSLRQLDPLALITLRVSGQCTVNVPEWFYDLRQTSGQHMRRIKNVAVSVPSVVGPYTGVSATLTLQSSTIRTSSALAGSQYARQGQDDSRFVDYFGSTDMIVTSSGSNDSGLFETNLRDERFLPFEGAGAISVWNVSLPTELRAFDYNTIADVILHIRYTARWGGDALAAQATKELSGALDTVGQSAQTLMFCLRFDFPTEWAAFVNGAANFQVTLDRFFFPYVTQSAAKLTIDALTLYAAEGGTMQTTTPLATANLQAASTSLSGFSQNATLSFPVDPLVLVRSREQLVYLVLQYHFAL
jgi:hypothetical protein